MTKSGLYPALGAVLLVSAWSGAIHARPQTEEEPTSQPESDRAQDDPRTPIPPLTDADREAAFPDVKPHRMRGDSVFAFVLVDQLEWQGGQSAHGGRWEAKGWVGRDRNRLWFRTEGQAEDGRLDDAESHLFYGRAFARWWDVLVGVRQDVRPSPAQTWAAFGVHGLAPYWFEVEATGYVGEGGQTAARFAVDYQLLLTNRLIMQPRFELDLYGKSHPERLIGAGLGATELGLRLRYELRRELAPYIGVTWDRTYGETRDFAEAAGNTASRVRLVAGLRLWY